MAVYAYTAVCSYFSARRGNTWTKCRLNVALHRYEWFSNSFQLRLALVLVITLCRAITALQVAKLTLVCTYELLVERQVLGD